MSAEHVERATERRRILRAIGRDESETVSDGDRGGGHAALEEPTQSTERSEASGPAERTEAADDATTTDVPDRSRSLTDGGALGTTLTAPSVLDPAGSDRGE